MKVLSVLCVFAMFGALLALPSNSSMGTVKQGVVNQDGVFRSHLRGVEQNFFDDFEAYVAGQQLVQQGAQGWTTWSNLPGSGEDPYVSNAYAYSGSNSVVIVQNNDLVKPHGQLTTGRWRLSWQMYIPSGKAGYFNTLAGFTPNPFNWGMEVFFDVGGNGRIYGGSSTPVTFNYTYDVWHDVEVIVDLDNDNAEFHFDGTLVHTWQWTLGANGAGSPLELDANDFYGATADDEMYIDDYSVEEIIPPVFFDDFEAYTAGQQLVQQGAPGWTTWSNLPGSGEDPYVSDNHAYSGVNSVVIVQNNDLVKPLGPYTTGRWELSFYMYIPSGKAGYFNTLAGFTPNPFNWGMEVYFDVGGTGRIYGGSSTPVTFTYAYDDWKLVEVIVDLDADFAEFYYDGAFVHSWQWTLGANGAGSPLELDANDFFGATADDEMYIDDYTVRSLPPTGIGQPNPTVPTEFTLEQNFPNPFNPTTTIGYNLKENATVKLTVYDVLGRVVKTLVNGRQTAGYRTVQWDGRNENGEQVKSGVYVYVLEANGFRDMKKMILVK